MPGNQLMSKARMLEILQKQQKGFVVDPFLTFTVAEWRRSPRLVINRIQGSQLGPTVILRSAVFEEDIDPDVAPGEYHSEANVPTASPQSISAAAEKVIASYARHHCAAATAELDEVLVQRQVLNPLSSGLIMSHDHTSVAPYYLVEYDDETGRTDRVTGGYSCKRAYILRKGLEISSPWTTLVKAARSIEALLKSRNLVIEFALTEDNAVHVFQVRQMPHSYQNISGSEAEIASCIRRARQLVRRHPETIWSNMADWNPAEMLGEHPGPLASSLYNYLIAQRTWTKARSSLGYRDVSPRQLIDAIAGHPYVNVAVSFESLCPASLPAELAHRLVANRIEALRARPELHDKSEFEIMFTCADVVKPARTRVLLKQGFTKNEVRLIEKALVSLTSEFLINKHRLLAEDRQRRRMLLDWLKKSSIPAGDSSDSSTYLDFIAAGLQNCRDLGTYSFSRLARLAFVGRDILGRLITAGAFTLAEYERFWRSIDTVASRVSRSIRDLSTGQISKACFDKEFGHLRPRTYDITSRRYDQSEFIVPDAGLPEVPAEEYTANLLPHTHSRISIWLSMADLPSNSRDFLDFVSIFMREREKSKFEFTAVLSACLEAIAKAGELSGFNRKEMSFLTVPDILAARAMRSSTDLKGFWEDKIGLRRQQWEESKSIRLPSLIRGVDDLSVIRPTKAKPNFITLLQAEGPIILIANNLPPSGIDLSGKVVVLEAADPGYDWIFAHRIAALVTKYGGAASHMAIRTAQFGIPAIIGCGDELYREFLLHRRARIDCKQGSVEFPA
jgi:phosphohistidine swiveling domain-containing protein